ncbi:MAG TPA: hypothetical protein VES42_08200 [Pilimelia sp.]|nr:hypothetical protein [Pilimelia sp.]
MDTHTPQDDRTPHPVARSRAGFVGLAIDRYDQWSDSAEIALYPSNICWCRIELGDDHESAA